MASLFWSLLLACVVWGYRMEAGVYELTTKTIDEWHTDFIDTLRMIQFYAPFDHKSKDFSPNYITLFREAQRISPSITFGKVDVSKAENKPLLGKYQVGEFPYLIFFRAGGVAFQRYEGEKTITEILDCLQRHLFNITRLTEVEQYERIVTEEFPLYGMLLAVVSNNETQLAKVFTQYAKENAGKFTFGLVEDKGEFAARFDLDSDAIVVSRPVVLLGKDDLAIKTITKAANQSDLHTSIQRTYHTLVSLWTKYTEDIVKSVSKPIVTLYFDLDWKRNLPHVRYMANRLRRAVESFIMYDETENRFAFTIADKKEYRKLLEQKQLYANNVLLTVLKGDQFYVLQESKFMVDNAKMRKEAITAFLDDYLGGKLETYVRSQDIPDEDYDHNVRAVVGQTFRKVVMSALKHVVLLVYRNSYAEAHKNDVRVQEAFAQLGALMRDSETVLVAKVEITMNEIPMDYTALDYPKIFFIPENEKYRPVVYDKEMTYEGLVKFLNENIEKRKGKKADL